jgi:PAS domain S-box-containing protein
VTVDKKNNFLTDEVAKAHAQSLQKIRKQIFVFSALSAIVLSLVVGIFPRLLGSDQTQFQFIATVLTMTFAAANFAIYMRQQNLRAACIAHVAMSNICYGLAIFASGGVQSQVIIFAPLVVVISGLLGGASLAIASAAFLSASIITLDIVPLPWLMAPPISHSSGKFLLEVVSCLVTVAGIISLYERIRTKNESSMISMNTALLKEKAHNDQIMNALDSSAIVAITDVTGKIIRVNDNFCRISGYSEKELLGQDHRMLNSGQHSKKFFVDIWRTIGSGKVWSGEIENRSKDGNTYFVQTVITPLANEEGKTERYLAVRFDVTKEREASRQLEEAQLVAKIGSWSYQVDNQCTFWSKQMFELHDLDSKLPAPDFDQLQNLVHPDDREHWLNGANGCLKDGHRYKTCFRIVTKTGRVAWLETVAEGIRNRDGTVIKVRGTCQDVTEVVIAEQLIKREQVALAARQRFLDTVLSNMPSMILVKDYRNDLRFSLINKAGEQLLGVKSSLILGKCDQDFFPKEIADLIVKKDREAFVNREILKIVGESIQTQHGPRLLSTTKVPTFDQDGDPEFLISISDDITEEVRMGEQLDLERAKVIQASKMASLGEMSAGIAHEINNPLAIIAGTARALHKFINSPDELQDRIQTIHRSITRIQKIVSGLRKFSRTSGRTEMKTHSLSEIVKEALVLTSAISNRFDVKVELDIEHELQIYCNEIEIEQVLVNLINNGIDAVKELDKKWLKITVFEDKTAVVLKVSDSGPGVPPQLKDKLFQPFFTTKPIGEGTGLGLAIVKGILDEHKATIEISSDSPTTSFVIRFAKIVEVSSVA